MTRERAGTSEGRTRPERRQNMLAQAALSEKLSPKEKKKKKKKKEKKRKGKLKPELVASPAS